MPGQGGPGRRQYGRLSGAGWHSLHFRGDALKGKKAEELLLKDGTIPDRSSTDNIEFNIVQTVIKRQLEGGETDKWNKIFNTCMGFSEDTFTGVHHLYTMEKERTNNQKW